MHLETTGPGTEPAAQFSLDQAAEALLEAIQSMDGCSAAIHASEGQSIRAVVSLGQVEERRFASTRGLSLSLYRDGRRSQASSNDLSWPALSQLLVRAKENLAFAAEDPCNGLPEPAWQAPLQEDLQLYRPASFTLAQATQLALEMEAAGLACDPAIVQSQSVSVDGGHSRSLIAMSNGFRHDSQSSGYSLGCQLIADRNGQREVDGWSQFGRGSELFTSTEVVARKAAARVLRSLGARPIKTQRCPVLFEAPVAHSLLRHLVHCISGPALYTGNSWLEQSLGQSILPAGVSLLEDPFRPGDMATRACDGDGIAASRRAIVSDGRLESQFLGLYAARRLGRTPTGSGYGPSHLCMQDQRSEATDDFAGLIRRMGRGLVVTGLGGQGFNPLTGEYSRSASGLWVEAGEIVHPVQNLTVAGTLPAMLAGLQRVGQDVLDSYGIASGSWLLQEMTVGGN